jgi:hypothetical protein
MAQKHRISTDIGKDQLIRVELQQEFDILEILSLKFTQKELYTSFCSDYGVVVGRISANNGLGIPNAKVSIFVPLSDVDENDPVISALYPYTDVTDKNTDNYRYNLLPSRKQHGGHEPTGTFPDQSDILNREEILEIFENYYKYTVKTNESGDFMIWGVPIGQQVLHIDVDLSDIGCFSLRPYDFIRQGAGTDGFFNTYKFKASSDLDHLPQIVSANKTIQVYPLWGNTNFCEIGITRSDFDLSSLGVKIEPKAFVIGGVYTDNGKNAINKNCTPRAKMGRKCDLVTKSANIEAIRFTPQKDENNRPILEYLEVNEDVPDDGGFVLPITMNMDYVYTNEFGENEITNNPNKGVPTSSCYRMRINLNDNGLQRTRGNADYLIPNIREFQSGGQINDQSYYFGTEWSGYPQNAVSTNGDYGILYNENGEYFPRDYFYRFNYGKVYTVSSFQKSYVRNGFFGKNQYLGLKELVPTEEEDCAENLTPPVNFGTKNYTFILLIADFLMSLDYVIKWIILQALNFLVKDVLGPLAEKLIDNGAPRAGHNLRRSTSLLQVNNTTKLSLINYPECDECDTSDLTNKGGGGDVTPAVNCLVATIKLTGSTDNTFDRYLPLTGLTRYVGYTSPTCDTATFINDNDYLTLTTTQTSYVLEYNGNAIFIDDTSYGMSYIFLSGSTYYLNDRDGIFRSPTEYTVNIRQIGQFETDTTPNSGLLESGCEIYDTLYNESLATGYFINPGSGNRVYVPTLYGGEDVLSTLIAGEGTGVSGAAPYGPPINGLSQCRDMEGEVHYLFTATPSYRSEFANGVFYIVPGTQSSTRLTNVLKEYYRRKRMGKLFCGGIVNYGFIDNWLSGSLYFFQFKTTKVSRGVEAIMKYCRSNVRYVSDQSKRFYYRSAPFNGTNFTSIKHPTTFIDLGPRDEFIKEICVDPSLDPNCSVSRSIGSSSFKSFGELMGLAINYRMDVSNNKFNVNDFFTNGGFTGQSFSNVFDGDLLQLISINNEAGIEEFDLQSPKYMGYSYQFLDPELYPQVFKKDGYWGPLPVTLELDEDGQRVRACLNEPGRLTEASQKVPFYLWDKKGTGFGGTSEATSDDQSWDYNSIQVQPLQGMKNPSPYQYKFTGGINDPSDEYLLLPITNTFGGVTIPSIGVTNPIEFDDVSLTNLHSSYDTQYPGFTFLHVTAGTTANPTSGTLYVRYGTAGQWQVIPWTNNTDFILFQREDYYNGTKQILSTPFQFYFGLKAGKTGLDKFIDLFGPKGAFTNVN